MPRVLFWNVEHFSSDKFYTRERKRVRDDDEDWGVNPADTYRGILEVVVSAYDLDFIVIVELQPGPGAQRMCPVVDDGAMRFLTTLRDTANGTWNLVPPLVVGLDGKAEGVAIYYRSDRYFFTGPWRFPGGNGPAAPGGGTGFYPDPWCAYDDNGIARPNRVLNALPNRTISNAVGNLHNRGVKENVVAAQPRFYLNNGTPQLFGVQDGRHPYLATFYDATNNVNYKIVAYHAPPGQDTNNPAQGTSVLGTEAMANLDAIQNPGANEVVIVVGDFNISLFDGVATAAAYGPMTGNGYTQAINTSMGFSATYPSKGYLTTHIKQVGTVAMPKATPANTNGYPVFGYGSVTDQTGTYDSIDNGFVHGGALANPTIVNLVAGSPYTGGGLPPVPNGCPAGHFAFAAQLESPGSLNVPDGHDPDGDDFSDWHDLFIEIDNYARVRGVSDHFPLMFDV